MNRLAMLFRPQPPAVGSVWRRRGDNFYPLAYEVVRSNVHGVEYRLVSGSFIKQPSNVCSVRAFHFEFTEPAICSRLSP